MKFFDLRNSRALACLAMLLLFCSQPLLAGVTAHLNQRTGTVGKTITLVIRYDGQTKQNPATRGLSKDFKILGTTSHTDVDFKNGQVVAHKTWNVKLKPKRAGKLRIPPVMIEGAETKALFLEVSDAPGLAQIQRPVEKRAVSRSAQVDAKPRIRGESSRVSKPVAKAEPTLKPVSKAVPKPLKKPAPKTVSKPVIKAQPKPVVKPTPKPVPQPTLKPATPPALNPVIQTSPEPVGGVSEGSPNVLIETSVEPVNPYVQQMVVYTVRIFHAIKLTEGELPDPKLDGALVSRLEPDKKFSKTIDKKRYRVIE